MQITASLKPHPPTPSPLRGEGELNRSGVIVAPVVAKRRADASLVVARFIEPSHATCRAHTSSTLWQLGSRDRITTRMCEIAAPRTQAADARALALPLRHGCQGAPHKGCLGGEVDLTSDGY